VGRSDNYIIPFYKSIIQARGRVALLGFSNNAWFSEDVDLYDMSLGNWDINSEWELDRIYDTIVCTRCAYFAKDPEGFIKRCYDYLSPGGLLYVDWGLGDHWRFENYKIGWVKDGEHEYAYKGDNYLWSTVWDESLLNDSGFKIFSKRVEKFGYKNIKEAIHDEVPKILNVETIKKYFNTFYITLALWEDLPQLYIIFRCQK